MLSRLMALRAFFTEHRILMLLLAGLIFLIAGSFFAEYVLGAQPCEMCWWQRYTHWAMAVVALLGVLAPFKRCQRYALMVLILLACGALFVAVWQSGGQLDFWALPGSCLGSDVALASGADLLSSLKQAQPEPSCLDWGVVIFGLSLAMWDAFAMTCMIVAACFGLWKGNK